MDSYSAQLRDTYKTWDTEELAAAIASGRLTESAVLVAREEISARGVEYDQLAAKEPEQVRNPPKTPNFFINCWNGKEPLWMAFWVLGFVINLVSGVLAGALISFHSVTSTAIALLFVAIPCLVFWSVSIWRCAFRSSHLAWGIIARFWVFGHTFFCIHLLYSGK